MTMSGKRTILNMIVRMVVASDGSRFAAVPPHEVVPLARGSVNVAPRQPRPGARHVGAGNGRGG